MATICISSQRSLRETELDGKRGRGGWGGGGEVTCGGDAVEKNRPPVSVFMGETSILEALGGKTVFFDLQERLLSRPPGAAKRNTQMSGEGVSDPQHMRLTSGTCGRRRWRVRNKRGRRHTG